MYLWPALQNLRLKVMNLSLGYVQIYLFHHSNPLLVAYTRVGSQRLSFAMNIDEHYYSRTVQ